MFVNDAGRMCANIHVNLCVLGANIHLHVGVWERRWTELGESTCESVCLGAARHVKVGVCK